MSLSPEKWDALRNRMERLNIFEADLIEKFIQGSGKGGQKINKTSSCVYLKHLPTGFEVKCQQERSRELNRYFARRLLCDKIESEMLGKESKKQQEIEKIRRQKRKRSKRAQLKNIEAKKQRQEIKTLRKPPSLGQ